MTAESIARNDRPLSQFEKISLGKQIVVDEAEALQKLSTRLPATFSEAVEILRRCQGAVIVIGIGKAGWVGQKMSATLASTGTRSHFLHPSEAMHGDLGRIGPDDVVVLLSNSGETAEVNQVLPTLERLHVKRIAITARAESTLSQAVDCVVDYGAVEEACPLGLAPTTSTTVMMALGDALAMVTSQCRGFAAEDFGQFHPGGSLGRKLASVDEIMRPLDHCRVAESNETVRNIYTRLAGPDRRSGAVLLVDETGKLAGIFTDSDLARLLERKLDTALDLPIEQVMTANPAQVPSGTRVNEAILLLGGKNLSELPVVNELGEPVGMIDVTDVISLLPAKR